MHNGITWKTVLGGEKEKPYFQEILRFIEAERAQGKTIYPPKDAVFNAYKYTELGAVRVVILGQDPYHGPNQAHGLAFSVQNGVTPPPSLRNIYKELCDDVVGFEPPNHGNLQSWAAQGVLLLNTVLTVEQGKAHAHAAIGWETFTDATIEAINHYCTGVVFLLWGSHAQKKGQSIDRSRHCVLTSVHPSPLSAYRGFLGCQHFSKANAYLIAQGKAPIHWQLPL